MSPVDETRAAALLRIDARRALAALADHVRRAAQPTGRPVLLGLSGGLDSTVLAAIAARSLSSGQLGLVYLYDRTSSPELRRNAHTVADWLRIPLVEISIEDELRGGGTYSSPAARLTSRSARLNRLLYRAYGVVAGESAFISSLRAGPAAAAHPPSSNRLHFTLAMQAEASFAARHRCRRRVLEARAAADGGLLLGAANRSEWLTGWFVPAGIDDLPDQPLKGLYKTQVRQLAVALNVPAPVLRAAPSPDMMAGISDELALGMSYATIDVALDRLAGGLTGVQAGEAGLTVGELRRVRQLTQLSAWKRGPFSQEQLPQTDVAPFPVDGGPGGGFRMAARDS